MNTRKYLHFEQNFLEAFSKKKHIFELENQEKMEHSQYKKSAEGWTKLSVRYWFLL